MSIFYERLSLLCAENGIEMTNLGKAIGIPSLANSTLSRWASGVTPRNATIKAIADYFKVDVAYLLGKEALVRSAEPHPSEGDCAACPCREHCSRCLSPQEKQLIDMFREASEIGKIQMLSKVLAVWEQDQKVSL